MIGAIISLVGNVADRFFDNKEQADKFKHQITNEILNKEADLIKASRDVVVAEATGHSWLQRNWRPILMLVCIFIVANNYILAPYAELFIDESITLQLDQNIWDLMKIGIGGYLAGRSAEKIAGNFAK